MNKIVSLYLSQKNVPARMDVVQGATAPGITFVLEDYEPNNGATARIFIKKKESEVYNTCELEGNEATFNPTTTSFDEVGKCTAQLEIVSGGKIAVSYRIYVNVEPNIIDSSAIEAADDFSALQDAILAVGDISEYKAQTDENTADISALETAIDTINSSQWSGNRPLVIGYGGGLSESVTVPRITWTNLTPVVIPSSGFWLVKFTAYFSPNSNGQRGIRFSNSSGSSSLGYMLQDVVNNAGNFGTYAHLTVTRNVTSTYTLYPQAYQNTDGDLTVDVRYELTRLGGTFRTT